MHQSKTKKGKIILFQEINRLENHDNIQNTDKGRSSQVDTKQQWHEDGQALYRGMTSDMHPQMTFLCSRVCSGDLVVSYIKGTCS